MSVQGPSPLPVRPLPAPAAPAAHAANGSRAGSAPAAANATAPAESSLWELLTDDERSFFSQQASLGVLTYGRGRTPAPAPSSSAPIGQRLDVRG